ncbi:MAG: hypothetical protein ACRDH6_00455 [Actinomycetota bacterium]
MDDVVGDVIELRERVVIAPQGGKVHLLSGDERPSEGEFLLEGDPLAVVRLGGSGDVPVRCGFRGWLMGYLVLDGQPISEGEPVAWVRAV